MPLPFAAPMTSIADLPDEILLRIFSYFSQKQITQILGNVCLQWKILSSDQYLWRNIGISVSDLHSNMADGQVTSQNTNNLVTQLESPNILKTVSANATRIDSLFLDKLSEQDVYVVFDSIGSILFELKNLRLSNTATSLQWLFKRMNPSHLHSLTMTGHQIANLDSIPSLPGLKRLKVLGSERSYFYPRPPPFAQVRLLIKACPNLEHLEVYKIWLDRETITYIFDHVSGGLKTFGLYDNGAMIKYIVHMIAETMGDTLESLTLEMCCYRPTFASELLPLGNLKNLKYLKLSVDSNEILTMPCLRKLFRASIFHELETLVLINVENRDDMLLKSIQENFWRLKRLVIDGWTFLSPESLSLFLKSNSFLQVLELRNLMYLSNLKFIEIIPPEFRKLKIKNCSIDGEEIEYIRKKYPEIDVVSPSEYFCDIHDLSNDC